MAPLQQWKVDKPWLQLDCELGESPFYESSTNTIRFVDIPRKHILTVSLDAKDPSDVRVDHFDVPISVTADIDGVDPKQKIAVGSKYGPAILDRSTNELKLVGEYHEPRNERVRSNDGACGPCGSFWLGTMTDFGHGTPQPEGCLFRYNSRGKETLMEDMVVPNQITWSPDQKTMYFTESTSRQVFACDYDPATGHVENRRVFYQHEGSGLPDGARVDVEGNCWHAIYAESRVIKINPEGQVVGQVMLPTLRPTCVQFAGTELIITTAKDDEGTAESKQYGGALFRVDVGVKGLELFKFKQ